MASTTTATEPELGSSITYPNNRFTGHIQQPRQMYDIQKASIEKELDARNHMHGVWTTLYRSAPAGPELRAEFHKQTISNLEAVAKLQKWLQAYEERFSENPGPTSPAQSQLPQVTTVENARRPGLPKAKPENLRVNEQALSSITLIR